MSNETKPTCGCGGHNCNSESAKVNIWHPIINSESCTECGKCVAKCTKGVFDKASPQKPIVIFKQGCTDGCHGCGNLCPTGSITYNGDNTGWQPPNAKK